MNEQFEVIRYKRVLAGGYYISLTYDVYVDEEQTLGDENRLNLRRSMAVRQIMTQPGLQLKFDESDYREARLELLGREEERNRIAQDFREEGKLLVLDYPMLAVTGRLMGWKLTRIDFNVKYGAQLMFCDVWTGSCVCLVLLDGERGQSPEFRVEAMGENGLTEYHYCGIENGKCCIEEESNVHKRIVKIDSHGVCEVEEFVRMDDTRTYRY